MNDVIDKTEPVSTGRAGRCIWSLSRQACRGSFHFHPHMVALCLSGMTFPAIAQDYFNPSFLDDGSGTPVDLSAYETAGAIPEGSYLVDVYMNQALVFTRQVAFRKGDDGEVGPVLTPGDLRKMGVATDRLPSLKGMKDDDVLKGLPAAIPDATVKFNMAKLRLELTVPQADMLEQANGTVDPSLWDEGIPGMMFSYMMSGSRNEMDGQGGIPGFHSDSLFGTVNGGANLGAWRLRSTWNYSDSTTRGSSYDSSQTQSQFINTYLQRDVQALRSNLIMGENSSGGDIFDSVPFRGVQLTSNDDMLPWTQRNYAPVVTGIANSTAKVSVRQNGTLIYETTVPPGPFRLTDIYNAGSGGTLEVTVTEADGTTHVSTQSYGTLSVMKRPGMVDYEVTAGRYHGNSGAYQGSSDPLFAMVTATAGLPHNLTLYGGIQAAEKYLASVGGVALSLGIMGAASFDTTVAQAKVSTWDGINGPDQDSTERGAALRLKYSKYVDESGTSLDVSGTRYTSSHYMTLQDQATSGYGLQKDQAPWLEESPRNSVQVNLSQTLGWLGSVFLQGSRDDYWNSGRVVNSVSSGFSSSIKGVNYSVNYNEDHTQQDDGNWPTNRQVSLNVSVPFSLFNPPWQAVRDIYATYALTSDNQGRTSQQAGFSGSFLDNKMSWSASQSHDNQGGGNSGNMSLGWQGDSGNINGSYGYGQNTKTMAVSGSGSVVMHPHGVAFTNMLGDAMAVVEAPGAAGVKVASGGNVTTDSRGYAVVPYLQSYQRNAVNLDTTSLPDGVDLQETSSVVYPTKGALVEAKFRTRVGRQAMLTLNLNGKPVPFGAIVMLPSDDAQSGSIVGDDGMVYLTGAPQSGELNVQWGTSPGQQCRVKYDLGPLPEGSDKATVNIAHQTLNCAQAAQPVQTAQQAQQETPLQAPQQTSQQTPVIPTVPPAPQMADPAPEKTPVDLAAR
ncbi:fimbria/pilus outer membrane usher protein [Citrobacter koseri]|uniref:fimbria/pilus outer membrane usher protein n=1 Tax=Citrobacter koseri TaxID=545 RepID=UPI000E06AAEE|nr:fimbria/pilus outer membrane usher protein [Citrobacter koseri]STB73299.1 fimbrial usher protein FimD [Citrobacter koseri]STT23478.1 putative fimbrial biogenesis outer membrane usher protein [Citrobacter koseri]